MASIFDLARLDLRGAFDFAIMVEEDAQIRYECLARLLGDEPSGAGAVFRAMAVNEAKHRGELLARRAAVFRDAPRRIDVSVLGTAIERPEVDPSEMPRTTREALALAAAAEQRAFDFYRDALRVVDDPAVRYFFEQLMDEEAEHLAMLAAKLAKLDAEGACEVAVAQAAAAPPPCPPCEFLDAAVIEAVLPRFDAATQAVARLVVLGGIGEDDAAAALGVSRRTVALKLARFLAIAREESAAAAARAGDELQLE